MNSQFIEVPINSDPIEDKPCWFALDSQIISDKYVVHREKLEKIAAEIVEWNAGQGILTSKHFDIDTCNSQVFVEHLIPLLDIGNIPNLSQLVQIITHISQDENRLSEFNFPIDLKEKGKELINSHWAFDHFITPLKDQLSKEDFIFMKAIDRALWLQYRSKIKMSGDSAIKERDRAFIARHFSDNNHCPFGDPECTDLYSEHL